MSDPFSPQPATLDIAGLGVYVAMPTHRDLHPLTVNALLQTQTAFAERGLRFEVNITFGGSLVHHGRTKIAHEFLTESQCNRLFWVDSDMVWEPADFLRLVALSTRMDLVAGCYPAKQDPPLMMLRGDLSNLEANEFGCISLEGCGMGFCCVTREAMQAVADRSPLRSFHNIPQPVPHMFEFDATADGAAEGEDIAFFRRAREAEFPLWVDPTIRLGHVGQKVFTGRLIDFLRQHDAVETVTASNAA